MNIRAGHHSSAVALSRLLGVYSKIDRRFQTLAVVFLCWAKRCELNDQESGYYCSSMFHTMVLYFLQQREKPILPVLHEVRIKFTSHEIWGAVSRLALTFGRFI
jgi:terminal uridylyltransferase